jgi:hypothetical protein
MGRELLYDQGRQVGRGLARAPEKVQDPRLVGAERYHGVLEARDAGEEQCACCASRYGRRLRGMASARS